MLTTRPAACSSQLHHRAIYIITTEPLCVYGIYCPGGSLDPHLHRWATTRIEIEELRASMDAVRDSAVSQNLIAEMHRQILDLKKVNEQLRMNVCDKEEE